MGHTAASREVCVPQFIIRRNIYQRNGGDWLFLLIYHLVLCIILLTGHILIAAAGTAMLFFYGTFAFGLVVGKYSSAFFDTYYRAEIMNLLAVCTSPYKLYGSLCGTDRMEDMGEWLLAPHFPELAYVLVIAAATFASAYLLFKYRPGEAAGRALAFGRAKIAVKFLLAIPATLIIGYYIMLCSPGSRSFLLLAIGILFGSFTINGLLEIIFQFDVRGMLSGKTHFIAICALCLLAAGSFFTDIWGYDKFAPEPKEMKSVAVAIRGLDDTSYAVDSPSDLAASGADSRLTSMQLRGKDKENLLSWLSGIRARSGKSKKPLTYAAIAYHMTDNRTIYRKYPITSLKDMETFNPVYESASYKKGAFAAIDHKSPGVRHYLWSNGIQGFHLDLTEKENKHLMRLLTSDLTALKISSLKQELPVGTLSLVYGTSDSGEAAPIYPSFSNTLDYLEEIGVPARKTINDYEITRIQLYEKRRKTSTFGKTSISRALALDTKDPQKIQEFAKNLIPEEYAANQILNPVNTKYQAIVSFKDSLGRTVHFVPMALKGEVKEPLPSL